MDKELIVVKGKVIEQEKGYHANVGKDIGYEAGAKMIKRHFDQHPDDVIAHFIGRDNIEALLNQPGTVGIRMFYALNELGIKQMVLVSVDENGNNILHVSKPDSDINSVTSPAIVMGGVRSCPPYCGTTTTTTTTESWW